MLTAQHNFARCLVRAKELQYGPEARQLLLEGVDMLSKAVVATLGPKGRNVMIEQPYGPPKVTKDGVSVAKSIEFKDKWHNTGAQLVISAAQKTNDAAGDGTTTATLLTQALFSEALKALSAGLDANELRKGMNLAIDVLLKELSNQSKKISTQEEISQVATLSANGDTTIGTMIADAFKHVGRDGVITVQNGKGFEHKLQVIEGMKIDRGFVTPFFTTDKRRMKCEFEKPLILLTDSKITQVSQIQGILEQVHQRQQPLLIIAEDIEGDALAFLLINHLQHTIQAVAIRAPGFGDNRKATLQDIASKTGAQVIMEEIGLKLETTKLNQLGTCDKITVSKEDCIILGGAGDKDVVKGRLDEIKAQLAQTESKYEKEKLQERMAKLTGSVAVIEVGGASEPEVGEAKDLIDDSLNATRAALEDGVVVGGGCALLNAAQKLKDLKAENLEQRTGIDIVMRAAQQPVKKIAQNAGQSGDVVVDKILAKKDHKYGYDARTDEYADLMKKGIVDPAKVVKTALQNAASIASSMSSVDVVIIDKPDKEPAMPPMPQMGGGMPGMY